MAGCREVTTPARVHRWLDKAAGRWDSELDVFAAERYFNGDDALSSSFSSAFRTHKHGQLSMATSSSEASWNSRSGLLPAAAPGIEAEPRASKQSVANRKSPSSSHLRRWMLGVAGCACIGVDTGEGSVTTDDDDQVEEDNVVGGQEEELILTNDDEAGKLFGRREESKEEEFLAAENATTSVRVMPGRLLDEFLLAGRKAAFSPVQLAGDARSLVSTSTPSEASVVWSVVTAEGAASCNFSSAASGYYYHHHINPGEDDDARRRNRRRRGIANSGGGLLTCVGDKAVDTVAAATVGARRGGRNGARP